MQLFRVGNRTCIVSYSHFRELHLCTLVFLYLFFRRKITEIDRAVIPSEVVGLEPYPPQFLKFGHVRGKGGCRACHMHLCQLRSPRGGRLDGFYFCLSFRRLCFWARKSQEKLDTQIRASPVQDSCYGCCLC